MRIPHPHLTRLQRAEVIALVLLVVVTLLFVTANPGNTLQQVQNRGELVVAMRIGNTTYLPSPEGATGFEYEMARAFADWLDVDLKVVVPGRFDAILNRTARGKVHLAAAGITITPEREAYLRFGPSYLQITEQLIHRPSETGRIRIIEDLADRQIVLVSGTAHVETLRTLQQTHPFITWEEIPRAEPEELLRRVWEGDLEATIVDSIELSSTQRFYPGLRAALDLTEPKSLAWAFPKTSDLSLFNEAEAFFAHLKSTGLLEQMLERYFGHLDVIDQAGMIRFLREARETLPTFEPLFREAAREHDLDWRLLAAISYQESHWNPDAISRTGVRGLMMLTLATAGELGIENRLDPRASVFGGTQYLINLRDRLPERIQEPDRTWMALAAYNIGMGHLHDARVITQRQGNDPDRWLDVMEHLPLQSRPEWHSQTRFGYARGWEPVQYVQNIRAFYDVLNWLAAGGELGRMPPSLQIMDIFPRGL